MIVRSKQFLLIPALGLWFAASAVPLAYFSAAHGRALHLASRDRAVAVKPAESRWRMVHLLVEGCGCSASIARHLCERLPSRDADEVVYVVGGSHHFDWVKNLQRLGFDVRVKNADEVRIALGTDSGPQLLIEDSTGAIRYRGGYQSTRPGTQLNHHAQGDEADSPQELEILSALRQGRDVKAYPAFGCAGSLSLP